LRASVRPTLTRAGRLADASVDPTEARKSAAPNVGPYPKYLRFFANPKKWLRIPDCDERTKKLTRIITGFASSLRGKRRGKRGRG
jgi:hypothetical protein